MQDYSVGFLHNDTRVVLVLKNRPEWQCGLFNGVGGHIEEGETPHECMVREFKEEAGVYVPKWDHFLTLEGTKARVYCFAANDNGGYINNIKTMTDEEIRVVEFIHPHAMYQTVPNLKWILPLMRQRAKYKPFTVSFYGDS